MKHLEQYNLFENNYYMSKLNNEIAIIIKKSGYIVNTHPRIYYGTLKHKKDLYCTTYKSKEYKYEDTLLNDTYSIKKLNYNPENYHLDHFLYPIEMLEKLYDDENVINYVELPMLSDLFKIVEKVKKIKKSKNFNL